MKKIAILTIIIGFLCVMDTLAAWDTYYGPVIVSRVIVGETQVWISTAPHANTCSCWGLTFRFPLSQANANQMLSILLSAKATGKTVDLWFLSSSVPGTTEPTCGETSMAIISRVGLSS